MKTLYSLTIILIFSFAPLTSQSHIVIGGKVLNKRTNEPLVNANILVKGTLQGTVTDELGNFTLIYEGDTGTLVVSYVGYITKEMSFNSRSRFIVIRLEPVTFDLETVKINSSSITPLQSVAKIDLNVRSVNTSQEVLRFVPGLFIAQHAGGGKAEQIFLRGFDSDHGTDINISVDDVPVNMVSQAHGQGYADLHWLIPELINEIDFGKGPYYAEYGDFETSGYIVFKTKTSLNKNMIKMDVGRFNTFRLVGMFNLLSENLKSKGQTAYTAMEYFMSDGPFENPQNFYRINLFGRYNYIVDQKNMFSVTFSLFNSKWNQSGQIPQTAVDDGYITRWGSIDPSEGGNTWRYNLYVKSMHHFDNGGTVSNLVYYTGYGFDLYSNFTFFFEDTIHGDEIRQKEVRNLFGYKGKYFKTFSFSNNSRLHLVFGGGLRFDGVNNSQLLKTEKRYYIIDTVNIGDIFETNVNLYGQFTFIWNKWLMNFGLRFDNFKFEYSNKLDKYFNNNSKYDFTVNPKVNIAYNFTEDFQLYLKLGKGFHSNDTRVVTSTDTLETLPSIYGVDLGILWKIAPRLLVNAAVWYSYFQEELIWSGDAGTWEPSGRTRRFGFDLGVRWQVLEKLFFDDDVNFGLARFIDAPKGENYVPLSPVITSTGGFTYGMFHGFNASLRYRFMGKSPADESYSVSTKSYFVCDLLINYTIENWTLGVSVENLFNSQWNEAQFASDYRVSPDASAQYGLTYTPGTPIFFKFAIKKSF
jgi:outer membrane receptor protein involved in Fe transport